MVLGFLGSLCPAQTHLGGTQVCSQAARLVGWSVGFFTVDALGYLFENASGNPFLVSLASIPLSGQLLGGLNGCRSGSTPF